MENPRKELPEIVSSLVQNRNLQKQRDTFDRYFTGDLELLHPMVSAKTRSDALAIFQVRSWILIHWSCDVVGVWYHEDSSPPRAVVEVRQYCRPWWAPFRTRTHSTVVILELQEVWDASKSKPVMKIARQRDHFEKSMALSELPVVGGLYEYILQTGVIGFAVGLFHSVITFLLGFFSGRRYWA